RHPKHPQSTQSHTLSLHDALPILIESVPRGSVSGSAPGLYSEAVLRSSPSSFTACAASRGGRTTVTVQTAADATLPETPPSNARSEEHTSELQSRENLVCRLLLEK